MEVDNRSRDALSQLATLPAFDLSYGLDDEENPTTVTVFRESSDEIMTHWISIDAEHAKGLDEIA